MESRKIDPRSAFVPFQAPISNASSFFSPSSPVKISELIVIGGALVYPTLLTCAYFLWLHDAGAGQKIVYVGGKILQFVVPCLWVLFVAKEPLQFQFGSRGLTGGLLFGAVVAAAMVVGYSCGLNEWLPERVALEVQAKLKSFGLQSIAAYAALSLFYALAHSLLEEYYWRWFVFRRLTRFLSVNVAIFISGLGFMAHHVILLGAFVGWDDPRAYLGSLAVAVGGWFWAWIYQRNGWQLLAPWLSHLLIDAAIFWIGYRMVWG